MNTLIPLVCFITFSLLLMMSIVWGVEGRPYYAIILSLVAGFGLFVGIDYLMGV